jgi:hypothetical protein
VYRIATDDTFTPVFWFVQVAKEKSSEAIQLGCKMTKFFTSAGLRVVNQVE